MRRLLRRSFVSFQGRDLLSDKVPKSLGRDYLLILVIAPAYHVAKIHCYYWPLPPWAQDAAIEFVRASSRQCVVGRIDTGQRSTLAKQLKRGIA